MSRPRITYLCLQVTRQGQASHAHVHEIIAGLERRGCAVRLFEPEYPDGPLPGALGRATAFLRVQRRLRRASRDADVIYIRAHFAAFPTAVWARRRRIPVIQEVNGSYEDLFVTWPWTRCFAALFTRAARAQYAGADAVITVTEPLAAWIEQQTGRADVEVVPNGANIEIFSTDASPLAGLPEKYVVFFGALAAWQGIETMVAAVSDDHWPRDMSLVVAGDGAGRPSLEVAATNDSRIVYLGPVTYYDVPRIVVGASAGLSPQGLTGGRSLTGLSPLKLFETLACGVPVIVTDFPGQADLVREFNCGLVIPPDDPSALAAAVAKLTADPEHAALMGRRGRRAIVMNHSWDRRAADTLTVMERVIAAKATG